LGGPDTSGQAGLVTTPYTVKTMIKNIPVSLALMLVTSLTNAQETVHKNLFWLNVSVGGSSKYLNTTVSYNKALENLSYQIAINGIAEGILSN